MVIRFITHGKTRSEVEQRARERLAEFLEGDEPEDLEMTVTVLSEDTSGNVVVWEADVEARAAERLRTVHGTTAQDALAAIASYTKPGYPPENADGIIAEAYHAAKPWREHE